jgi:hypothetical protein
MLRSLLLWILLYGLALETVAWSTCFRLSHTFHNNVQWQTTRLHSNDDEFGQEKSETQRQQDTILENMSVKGAKAIAGMEVPERAKRAILAEAVEDQIFELNEKLDGFFDENGMIAEESREKAVEIAKATKSLQIQYNDLVTGQKSPILDALNAMEDNMSD